MSRTLKHAILFAAAAICSGCRKEPVYEKPRTPVRAVSAEMSEGASGIRYSADIRAALQLDLAFRVGGFVQDLLAVEAPGDRHRDVQEGDRVPRGAVLARLRTAEHEHRLLQAQGKLDEAAAAAEEAQIAFARAEGLLSSASLTQAEFDGARARRDAARARVLQARGAADEARIALEDCELKSPFDGVIMRRRIERGSLVSPGTPAFSLADITTVKVVFGAPDLIVGSFRLGDPLAITTETARGESFAGTISRIAPWADPRTRVFEVELTVPNPGGRLRPGMVASLRIPDRAARASALVIPLSAVLRPPGGSVGHAVFVLERVGGVEHARLRKVTLGDVVGTRIEVREGLAPSERVVTHGATLLVDGEAVEVMQ